MLSDNAYDLLTLLHQAELQGTDLAAAGTHARKLLGMSHEEYGTTLERLAEDNLIRAEVQRTGSGKVSFARALRLTEQGVETAESIQRLEERQARRHPD